MAAGVTTLGADVYQPVGRLDDIHVVLDDQHGVAVVDKSVERLEQNGYVVEMEAGSRFVEDEEHAALLLLREVIGEFHALVLAARKRRRRLPELYVSEADILQRPQAADDLPLLSAARLRQELYGLVDSHVEKIIDVLSAVFDIEHLLAEALAVACLALHLYVGHELHRDCYRPLPLALLAAAPFGVEREVCRREAHLLRQLLVGEQLADLVVGLEIGGRIAARRRADRVLVDELHGLDVGRVSAQLSVGAGRADRVAERAHQRLVEDLAHQCRLSRTAHAGDHRHDPQRKLDIDVLEIVLGRADHLDGLLPGSASRRHLDAALAAQVFDSIRVMMLSVAEDLAQVALEHDAAAVAAGVLADVDDLVGGEHYVLVMLDDDHRIAYLLQTPEHTDQPLRVARMEPDAGFVEDVERTHERAA